MYIKTKSIRKNFNDFVVCLELLNGDFNTTVHYKEKLREGEAREGEKFMQ